MTAVTPIADSTIPIDTSVKNKSIEHTTNTVKSTDYNFLSDSVFHGYKKVLKHYCSKYYSDTCELQRHEKSDLIDEYEGVKYIGSIRNNKHKDFVFVLGPFTYCDNDGESYYFTDTTLPRLETDSYCCHPDNLFSIGDIDEDGISEICIFYSSCVSRFKSLIVYSLKDGKWKQVGRSTFDINVMKPVKEKRVRKISKGRFEMLEIVINDFEQKPAGDREWKRFSF